MSSVATGATDTGADDSMQESDIVPKELKDLRMRLNYLKNIYDIKDTEVRSSICKLIIEKEQWNQCPKY